MDMNKLNNLISKTDYFGFHYTIEQKIRRLNDLFGIARLMKEQSYTYEEILYFQNVMAVEKIYGNTLFYLIENYDEEWKKFCNAGYYRAPQFRVSLTNIPA